MRAKTAPELIHEAWNRTSGILELQAIGARDGKAFQACHLLLTSQRTNPEALPRVPGQRWSLKSWHWIHDIQLHEISHR